MIFVKLEGKAFFNEIYDVVKLFYPDDDIVEVKDDPWLESRGIILSGNFHDMDGERFYRIRLVDADRVHYEKNIPVEPEAENEFEIRKSLKNDKPVYRNPFLQDNMPLLFLYFQSDRQICPYSE